MTPDALNQAIDAGDKKKAKKLSKYTYIETLAYHDLSHITMTSLLSSTCDKLGDDEAYKAQEGVISA